MEEFEVILWLLVSVVILAALADRVRIAYPIALIIGGMVFGAAPFIPLVTMDPELVLLVLLAPSLFSAAISLDWTASRAQQRPILELAIRLVLTSTVGVAIISMLVISGMEWSTAFLLGAIVSPPDAVATISVIRRLRLPGNLVTIIEGESLVNDATALVLYRVAVAAVVTGSFSALDAIGQFFVVSAGGIAVGLLVGWVVYWFLLRVVQNPAISVAVSLLTPIVAYLFAEESGVSGVLAVVAAGLVTARKTLQAVPSRTRYQTISFWQLVSFVTEGFAFVLIGLQLPFVIEGISDRSWFQLAWYAVAIIATTVVIRVVWVYWEISGHLITSTGDAPLWGSGSTDSRRMTLLGGIYRRLFRGQLLREEQRPQFRGATVIAWSGLRGIVTLATALAIPFTTDSGEPFPDRDLIIFLAFCVILATLVGQGATLPFLIRRLRFPEEAAEDGRFQQALGKVLDTGLRHFDDVRDTQDIDPLIAEQVRGLLRRRRETIQRVADQRDAATRDENHAFDRLAHGIEEAERRAIREMAASGEISEALRRGLERRLDLQQIGRESPS